METRPAGTVEGAHPGDTLLLLDTPRNVYTLVITVQFEWDEVKNALNLQKHGLSFERAHVVFEGRRLTWLDDRYQLTEERSLTVGTLDGVLVVVAHTQRGETIRIISMRKANAREQTRFRQRLAD